MNQVVSSPRRSDLPSAHRDLELVLDVAFEAVGTCLGVGAAVARATVLSPLVRGAVSWRPPFVPDRLQPVALLDAAARRGALRRAQVVDGMGRLLTEWAPVVVELVVSRLDLTHLVLRHVDIGEVVGAADVDAVVARVDVDAVLGRIDLDAVLERVDLDAVAARIDLDAVAARIDLDAVVDRIDLDALVGRVDLNAAMETVDLDGIAGRIDLDAVIDRIDLVGIVEEVMAVIDLPGIIRDSTGSMASETVRSARMTGISADEAISRGIERHLFRRRRPPDTASP